MKIKIVTENLDKLNAAIDAVQHKARVRCITAEDVIEMTETVTRRLSISKKAMDGVTFSADYFAQAFPNAYKGIPESTIISAEFRRGNWYLMDVRRGRCRRPTVGYSVMLTDAAKAAIIDRCATFGG